MTATKLLRGESRMHDHVRRHDWSQTPLGPIESWPQSLRTAVAICLDADSPHYVWWGPELTQIYNDAAADILFTEDPGILGQPARACWPRVWSDLGPLAERTIFTGVAQRRDDFKLLLGCDCPSKSVPFNLCFSALRNEAGNVAGLLLRASTTDSRLQAETIFNARELHYRLLAEASSDAIYRMSPDWSEMRNLEGRNFITDTKTSNFSWLEQYIIEEDRPLIQAAIAEAIRTRSIFKLEHRVFRTDGSVGWTFSRAIPLMDARGEIFEWIGMAKDITARKHAEAALREREQRLAQELASARLLQAASAQLIREDDPGVIYQQLIDTAAKVMRSDFTSIQMLVNERNELELLGDVGFDAEARAFWKWVRVESATTCGMALRTGRRVIVPDVEKNDAMSGTADLATCLRLGIHSVQTTPLVARDGRLLGMISTHWKQPHTPCEHNLRLLDVLARQAADFIERTHAEAALSASEQRYRHLYDNNPTMYFTLDHDGRIVSVNRFGAERLGYGTGELTGRSFLDLHRKDAALVRASLDECTDRPGEVHEWECRIECQCGDLMWVRESARAVMDPAMAPSVLVVCEDTSERRELMRQATYHATHDALTGLENRREFENRLARVMETARKHQTDSVLCFLDLDQFKLINDTCGHLAGDELLRQVGEVLCGQVRTRDTVARLGGDEFGILLEHCDIAQGEQVASECLRAVEGIRFHWDERIFTIGVSIGVVAITSDFGRLEDALQAADAACYAAKVDGRNRINIHASADADRDQLRAQALWLTHLSETIRRGALEVVYQPIVPLGLGSGSSTHYEALVRIRDGDGKQVPAAAFLPTAERYSLVSRLDRRVAEFVFDWFCDHPVQVQRLTWCSINLSAQTLNDTSYLEFVKQNLCNGPLPPHKVCFEITETVAITNITSAKRFMEILKEVGCKFALDDFGSGFSSFSHLKTLPVDFLKIDGAFVRDVDEDPIDFAIVKSLNEIAHVMGKKTIAEYVERETVAQKLRSLGIDYAQGHLFGEPQPLEAPRLGTGKSGT